MPLERLPLLGRALLDISIFSITSVLFSVDSGGF